MLVARGRHHALPSRRHGALSATRQRRSTVVAPPATKANSDGERNRLDAIDWTVDEAIVLVAVAERSERRKQMMCAIALFLIQLCMEKEGNE